MNANISFYHFYMHSILSINLLTAMEYTFVMTLDYTSVE